MTGRLSAGDLYAPNCQLAAPAAAAPGPAPVRYSPPELLPLGRRRLLQTASRSTWLRLVVALTEWRTTMSASRNGRSFIRSFVLLFLSSHGLLVLQLHSYVHSWVRLQRKCTRVCICEGADGYTHMCICGALATQVRSYVHLRLVKGSQGCALVCAIVAALVCALVRARMQSQGVLSLRLCVHLHVCLRLLSYAARARLCLVTALVFRLCDVQSCIVRLFDPLHSTFSAVGNVGIRLGQDV